jgi:hypothetical protein
MLHWNWNKSNLLVGRSDLVRRHGAQSREARMTNDSVSPASISGHDGKEEPEVSRRGFFQQALGGVALAGAGAFSMVTMSGPVQAQYGGYGGARTSGNQLLTIAITRTARNFAGDACISAHPPPVKSSNRRLAPPAGAASSIPYRSFTADGRLSVRVRSIRIRREVTKADFGRLNHASGGQRRQAHISSATEARLWRRAHALGREPGRNRVGMARMQTIEI